VERFELATEAGLAEQVDVAALARECASERERVRVVGIDPLHVASLSPVVGRRVLAELIDNALEFSPPGSPVEVRVGAGPGRIEVRVVDQGSGVDAADRERIFGFLEQVEDLNVRVHQGIGLGLSVARVAARSMGGDVVLEDSGPGGSTFLWTIALED